MNNFTIEKKEWSLYPLIGFIVTQIFLWIISFIYMTEYSMFISLTTNSFVFGITFCLYLGAFRNSNKPQKNILVYRMRWLQDILLITGILGTLTGLLVMMTSFAGSGGPEVLALGTSFAFLALLYSIIAITLFYIIEKQVQLFSSDKTESTSDIKRGINIRSIVGLIGTIILYLFGILIMTPDLAGFLSLLHILFFALVLILLILILDGKILIRALCLPFYKPAVSEKIYSSMLNTVRLTKRCVSIIVLPIVFSLPIVIMGNYGDTPLLSSSIAASAIGIVYLLFMLLYLYLVEGLLVQQIYDVSNVINFEDRFFIAKFVLPPSIFWFSTVIISTSIYLGLFG